MPGPSDNVSQVAVEVLRSRYTSGSLANVAASQVVIEVMVPFVAVAPHFLKVGSASVVLHAVASATMAPLSAVASSSVVVHLAASAVIGHLGRGVATAVLRASAVCDGQLYISRAQATAVLRARCLNRFPEVAFGDDYLGRFQSGDDVPLLVLVRDKDGSPADPTVATPTARVYNLDVGRLVATVDLAHLRSSRMGSLYGLALRLDPDYVTGRYGVVYRSPTGGFIGFYLAIFEVSGGGDPSGPVIASHALRAGVGDAYLGHLRSGDLMLGTRPSIY